MPPRHRYIVLIISLCAWLVLIDANTGVMGLSFVSTIDVHGQMALWLLSIGGIGWGLGMRPGRVHRLDARIMFALFGGALVLRLMGLESYLRALVDELNTIGGVIALWERPEQRLLWTMSDNIMPYPYHYVWLHEVTVHFFGRSLWGLRVVDALMGALSVVATYGLLRQIAMRRTALIGGLVVMSLPLHLHITRLALINVTDALLLPLLVWAMLAGLRWRGDVAMSRSAWLWAGLFLGLLQYFYEGGRLLSLPLVGAWLVMLVLLGQMRRRDWRGVGWMALMAGFVAFPLLFTWSQVGAPVAGRLSLTAGDSTYWMSILGSRWGDGWLEVLLDQILRAFSVYFFLPDQSPFYMGSDAMLLPFVVPFALMGILASVLWRAPLRVVLLLWLMGIALANGIFMLNSAIYSRFIGATPALACLVALGLEGWLLLIRRLAGQRGWRGAHQRARRLVVLMAGMLFIAQTGYYFGLHLPTYNFDYRLIRPYPDVDDAILRASQQLPMGVQVHLIIPHTQRDDEDMALTWALIGAGQGYVRDFMRFLRDDLQATSVPSSQLSDYIAQLTPDVGHAFFVPISDAPGIRLMSRRFPQAIISDSHDPRVPIQRAMRLYYVPGGRSLAQINAP